jgi:hypothetical protein
MKRFGLLAALLWIGLCVPSLVHAENGQTAEDPGVSEGGRNLYVGDLITLEIAGEGLSAEEIREAFRDFEIVELKEGPARTLITIRTFEPGEYSVPLRNQEIVVTVRSTLEDIQREDVFEGGTRVVEPGLAFPWRMLFYIAAGIFVLSGGVMLFRMVLKRKTIRQTPYQRFLRNCGALAAESDRYFVDLTLHFKTYLENLYPCRLMGKSSAEILDELRSIPALDPMLPEIGEWLAQCDRFKFAGVKVSTEKKREHYETLLGLAEKIHRLRTDEPKEGAA